MITPGGSGRTKNASFPRAGKITSTEIYRLIERQQFKCALSGRDLTPDIASIDHKLALARGGNNAMGNLQVLHSDVNRAKGTLTNAEFVALCREVVAHADNRLPG